jgi:hypothetical protein
VAVDTLKAVPSVFRRLLLWDYQRGVWQYDVICGIIILFIFCSPRDWFRDQPRIPNAAEITSLPSHLGESEFFVEPELVNSIPEDKRLAEIAKILTARTRKTHVVTRIDALSNSEGDITGYIAFTKP